MLVTEVETKYHGTDKPFDHFKSNFFGSHSESDDQFNGASPYNLTIIRIDNLRRSIIRFDEALHLSRECSLLDKT